MQGALIRKSKSGWQSEGAKNITFIVTKDCQLACKYCYLVGKNSSERMTWDVAKAAIDYILCHEEDFPEHSVVWDFIGGEPFLEIDLIDRICDYLKSMGYEICYVKNTSDGLIDFEHYSSCRKVSHALVVGGEKHEKHAYATHVNE